MWSDQRKATLLVCDLDNTLYDWIGYFVPAFYAMVDEAVQITGCDRDKLLDDLREIHRHHGDSEHPFALLETGTIRKRFQGLSLQEKIRALDPAFHAFNSVRKRTLRLHTSVASTLKLLSEHNIPIVAHTESKLYAVVDRLRRLGIIDYFQKIYCRERSSSRHPNPQTARAWLEGFPMHKVVELSHYQRKPDEAVLLEICMRERSDPGLTSYIGDSVARDVLMAKRAGVFAIWAAYGALHDTAFYQKLVRISHWAPEDITREGKLREEAKTIKPDYVCHESFSEILAPLGVLNKRVTPD
jgi:phosphoglycolate phosphatase